MENWKFYIETYGCKVNQYESQALRESWQRAGGVETADAEDADYILINSCAITGRAERNARNAVFRLKQRAPQAQVILSGCAAQFYEGFTPRKNANWARPDRCVPQQDKSLLLAGPAAGASAPRDLGPIIAYPRSRPVVKIQDGCSQNCAYCIVPQTRGKPRGRVPEEVLAECRRLAARGYGELVLSGVNLRQCPGGFWKLLAFLDRELSGEYSGKLRLRVSSIDPAMLDNRALEIIDGCRLLCPHLHLSLQHASEPVLAAMRRSHYSRAGIKSALAELEGIWPIFGLGADILVGFPGETEDDIKTLLDFISEIPLTYAHVFPYSRRQGTPARDFSGQLEKREKERRAAIVRSAVATKNSSFLQKQLALPEMRIAVELSRDGDCRGVNEFYTTCVFKNDMARSRALVTVRPKGIAARGDELIVAERI